MRELKQNYEVKYHPTARQEAKRFLKTAEQYLFCVGQAKLLRFFPARSGAFEGKFFNLDIRRVEDYWELRVWDKVLEHVNVRILFAAFRQPKELWVLSAYAKKQQKTPLAVKKRCRKRIRVLERQGYRR